MARNTYTLDGIPLTDPDGRWFLEASSGLRTIPAKRMANVSYPGTDGDAFIPGAPFLPGGVRISMWVEGVDHEDFMHNVEYLNALFLQRHKLLELRHDYDANGMTSRHAFVKFTSGGEIQLQGTGARQGIITYGAEIPGVFWRSTNESTQMIDQIGTTAKVIQLFGLQDGNAPVADALIRFKGGFSMLEIEDHVTRAALRVNTLIGPTEYVIVDCANWTARKVTSNTWEGGTNIDMSVISNRGYGSMFVTEPSLRGTDFIYQIGLRAENPDGNPSVEIRAKKSYL